MVVFFFFVVVSIVSGSGMSAVVSRCRTTNSGRNNMASSTSKGPSYTVTPDFINSFRSFCFAALKCSRFEVSESSLSRASSSASKILRMQMAVSGSMSAGGP